MSKPTILVIPGSFSQAFMYDDLLAAIKPLGYPVEIASLPTSSRKPPEKAATLADDAQFYNDMLKRLCHDEGKNVVVVGHSYGGIVATEAVKGFTNAKDGKGKVVALVYLTCLVPTLGSSLTSLMAHQPDLGFIALDGDFMYHHPVEASAAKNFSDLPLDLAIEHAKKFSYHSAVSFINECTYCGYEDVDKVAYILCTKDETVLPETQRMMIKNIDEGRKMKGKSGECKVVEFESGHCPPASRAVDLGRCIAGVIESF